jgi:ketosteroid isomerase-like protein
MASPLAWAVYRVRATRHCCAASTLHDRNIDPRNDSGLLSLTPMGTWNVTLLAERKWHRALGVFLLALAAAVPVRAGFLHAERHEDRHAIDRLEEQWRAAILNGNSAAMESLLADDYMAITPNGTLQSKEQAIANLKSGTLHLQRLEVTDRKVRFYGSTALVRCRAEVSGKTADGDLSGSYRYTRVYVQDTKGVWRIVSFEANRIREPAVHK